MRVWGAPFWGFKVFGLGSLGLRVVKGLRGDCYSAGHRGHKRY